MRVQSVCIRVWLQLTDNWALGSGLCHVVMTAFAVVVFSSSFNLMMIAVDRYILIVKPLHRRMSPCAAVAVVVAVAALAAGAAMPIALYADLEVVDDPVLQLHRVYCIERWPSPLGRQLYVVCSLVGQFVVPLTVIVVLYYRIFDGLRARAAAAAAASTSSEHTRIRVTHISSCPPCYVDVLFSCSGYNYDSTSIRRPFD